eukprot:5474766-Prymnesium_polylepis.2
MEREARSATAPITAPPPVSCLLRSTSLYSPSGGPIYQEAPTSRPGVARTGAQSCLLPATPAAAPRSTRGQGAARRWTLQVAREATVSVHRRACCMPTSGSAWVLRNGARRGKAASRPVAQGLLLARPMTAVARSPPRLWCAAPCRCA